jgi:hypothetical protein
MFEAANALCSKDVQEARVEARYRCRYQVGQALDCSIPTFARKWTMFSGDRGFIVLLAVTASNGACRIDDEAPDHIVVH